MSSPARQSISSSSASAPSLPFPVPPPQFGGRRTGGELRHEKARATIPSAGSFLASRRRPLHRDYRVQRGHGSERVQACPVGRGSLLTRRWRKPDSNPRCHDQGFESGACGLRFDPLPTEKSARTKTNTTSGRAASRSRRLICWLTVDWVRCSRSAARRKPPHSATATRCLAERHQKPCIRAMPSSQLK
jgi:hypothetical protein